MKKLILSFVILALSPLFPTTAHPSYLIHLENGGWFTTPLYWKDGAYIMFYVPGGLMGIEKNSVRKIERSTLNLDGIYEVRTSEKQPAEAEQKAEKILSPQKPPEKIDLKAYQDKMTTLKVEANKTLARLRKAIKNKDRDAKAEAAADQRNVSAEMRKLTDELKEKNNGELPADWYDREGL